MELGWWCRKGAFRGFCFLHPVSQNAASSYSSLGVWCHYLRRGGCFHILLGFVLDVELSQGEVKHENVASQRTGEDCEGGQRTRSPPLSSVAYVRAPAQSHSKTAERRAPSRSLVTGRAQQGLAVQGSWLRILSAFFFALFLFSWIRINEAPGATSISANISDPCHLARTPRSWSWQQPIVGWPS